MSAETSLREAVLAAALALEPSDLGVNRSGNVSARFEDGFLITPSGLPYRDLAPDDLCFVSLVDGEDRGRFAPSSETPMHAAIYRARPDAGAIVHCHSPYATALACTRQDIPAFHYMVATAGTASIPCAPYATFGTEELSRHTVEALGARGRACLLANHGQVALGADPARALELAREVEMLARQYAITLQLGGPALLGAAEMDRVLEKFRTYGRRDV